VLFIYNDFSRVRSGSHQSLVTASGKWLRGLCDQSSSIRPPAAETSCTKFLTTKRSAVEGGRGQVAATAFIQWQDGDGEALDIDTDPKPVVIISENLHFSTESICRKRIRPIQAPIPWRSFDISSRNKLSAVP
jgi:hypothetical protein